MKKSEDIPEEKEGAKNNINSQIAY